MSFSDSYNIIYTQPVRTSLLPETIELEMVGLDNDKTIQENLTEFSADIVKAVLDLRMHMWRAGELVVSSDAIAESFFTFELDTVIEGGHTFHNYKLRERA